MFTCRQLLSLTCQDMRACSICGMVAYIRKGVCLNKKCAFFFVFINTCHSSIIFSSDLSFSPASVLKHFTHPIQSVLFFEAAYYMNCPDLNVFKQKGKRTDKAF